MASTHARASNALPARLPATRPNLSKSARRDVRRAGQLAKESDFHSFKLHGIVWTIRHDRVQHVEPSRNIAEEATSGAAAAPSKKKQRDNERAKAHRTLCDRADGHRLARLFRSWRAASTPPPQVAQQQQPQQMALEQARYYEYCAWYGHQMLSSQPPPQQQPPPQEDPQPPPPQATPDASRTTPAKQGTKRVTDASPQLTPEVGEHGLISRHREPKRRPQEAPTLLQAAPPPGAIDASTVYVPPHRRATTSQLEQT